MHGYCTRFKIKKSTASVHFCLFLFLSVCACTRCPFLCFPLSLSVRLCLRLPLALPFFAPTPLLPSNSPFVMSVSLQLPMAAPGSPRQPASDVGRHGLLSLVGFNKVGLVLLLVFVFPLVTQSASPYLEVTTSTSLTRSEFH